MGSGRASPSGFPRVFLISSVRRAAERAQRRLGRSGGGLPALRRCLRQRCLQRGRAEGLNPPGGAAGRPGGGGVAAGPHRRADLPAAIRGMLALEQHSGGGLGFFFFFFLSQLMAHARKPLHIRKALLTERLTVRGGRSEEAYRPAPVWALDVARRRYLTVLPRSRPRCGGFHTDMWPAERLARISGIAPEGRWGEMKATTL